MYIPSATARAMAEGMLFPENYHEKGIMSCKETDGTE